MKEFNFEEGIIIRVPDDREMQREEAFAIALLKLQEIIADGSYAVTQRLWPCIFCDIAFKNQTKLMGHVREESHVKKEASLHRLADKYMEATKDEPPPHQFAPYESTGKPATEHHKEYAKQYYIKKQLGEI
jgi:hypothetical protein